MPTNLVILIQFSSFVKHIFTFSLIFILKISFLRYTTMKKKLILFPLLLSFMSLFVPICLSFFINLPADASPVFSESKDEKAETIISVFNPQNEETDFFSLEEYLVGVVAAEMPALYEEEALKAQAVAARTYILNKKKKEIPEHKGADICSSPAHCKAYSDTNALKEKWGDSYDKNLEKIKKAVSETENLLITYEGSPIEAYFFALSNGKTDSSEDVWGGDLPYLKSVDSSFDKEAENFFQTQKFSLSEFNRRLGFPENTPLKFSVSEKTKGGRIKTIKIGGKAFSGSEIRNIFSLPSADFEISEKKGEITITTKGRGHGVGMSQFGANSLAKSGKSFSDILLYYYKGCKIEDFTKGSF